MTLNAHSKSAILLEALPYIQRWSGKAVVVKVGGEIVDNPQMLRSFTRDLTLMSVVGLKPILVHGGGNQISAAMVARGLAPRFVAGYRVTDREAVSVVREVMVRVNGDVSAAIEASGGRPAPFIGDENDLLASTRLAGPNGEDLGLVGQVNGVSAVPVKEALELERIPVIAPLGCGVGGQSYNINADLAASAVAVALNARKIVFLTNTEGLYRDLGDLTSLISEATVSQLRTMLEAGHLSKGMIPKISAVVRAMDAGVPQAHILDGRVPHCLLLEVYTDEGSGTMVTP
ncbi:MAG: acetylglutamate kinase [Actinomycetota bacterium]